MAELDNLPDTAVRSQLIPLADMRLLLPTTCIAEIVSWQTPEPLADAPEWLLGTMEWRGLRIPLVSFEAANDRPKGEIQRRGRVAVLNGIGGDPELPFYAIQVQGIPHLNMVDKANLEAISETQEYLPLVLAHATLQGQEVLIPDQDKLEAWLKAAGIAVSSVEGADV